MKKSFLGTFMALLASLTTVALAQQQPPAVGDLRNQLQTLSDNSLQSQLQKLKQTVKPTSGANADIQAPVSPAGGAAAAAPDAGAPGGVAQGQPSLTGGAPGTVDASAPIVVKKAPPPQPEIPLVAEQAFDDMAKVQLPMSPDQIRTLKTMFDEAQKAAAEHPGTPPKPTSTSQIVDLSPGATPPIIRLQGGFVTSIVFLDATGAPWPIAAYDIGDPRSFNVQWDQKSNTMMVQAISGYKTGNVAVMLRDLNTPIMLTLLPGQKAVDYRVDLRLPGIGPNSQTTVTHLPGKENPALLDVLNGVPPQGSTTLKIAGCSGCSAWLYNGEIFFRTRLTILSPGWIATLTSADGMHAYQLPSTPVVLVSDKGKMVTLTVEGF
jgi:intracellular multiplication protein IcmK